MLISDSSGLFPLTDAQVVTNWTPECTLLIMNSVTVTVKVPSHLLQLSYGGGGGGGGCMPPSPSLKHGVCWCFSLLYQFLYESLNPPPLLGTITFNNLLP